jgi:ATP-binding cassette subfamily G (WHITE) protein 2
MGALFWQVNDTQGGIQNRLGVLFFVIVNQTFGVVMPIINVLPLQRDIIKRERTSGTYRASSAFIAKFLSSLPLAYIGSLLLSIPVYWMVGLQNNIAKFFIFQAVALVHTHTANAMGLMIGAAVPNVQV